MTSDTAAAGTPANRDAVDGAAGTGPSSRSTCAASHSTRRHHGAQSHLTRTVIAVVIVFILGEVPSAMTSRNMIVALFGLDAGGGPSGRNAPDVLRSVGYRIAVLVSTTLVVMQHSANFVVYCVFNRRFCDFLRRQMVCGATGGVGTGSGRVRETGVAGIDAGRGTVPLLLNCEGHFNKEVHELDRKQAMTHN